MRAEASGPAALVREVGVPALFVVLWSTGFIGAKLGLPHAPPLTFLAVRFWLAAALLALLAWPRGRPGRCSGRRWVRWRCSGWRSRWRVWRWRPAARLSRRPVPSGHGRRCARGYLARWRGREVQPFAQARRLAPPREVLLCALKGRAGNALAEPRAQNAHRNSHRFIPVSVENLRENACFQRLRGHLRGPGVGRRLPSGL
jgi:hypothetical protein